MRVGSVFWEHDVLTDLPAGPDVPATRLLTAGGIVADRTDGEVRRLEDEGRSAAKGKKTQEKITSNNKELKKAGIFLDNIMASPLLLL